MALRIVAVVAVALHGVHSSVLSGLPDYAHPNGHPRCPCISAAAFAAMGYPRDGVACYMTDSAKADMSTTHGVGCMDKAYGIGKCGAWDQAGFVEGADVTTFCGAGANPPDWCNSYYCWVDPNNCDRPLSQMTRSTYLNDTLTGQPGGLFFSYTTCGSLQQYDGTGHESIITKKAKNSGLRVAFPNVGGAGHHLQPTGNYTGFEVNGGMNRTIVDSGRTGSLPLFFAKAMKSIGIAEFEVRACRGGAAGRAGRAEGGWGGSEVQPGPGPGKGDGCSSLCEHTVVSSSPTNSSSIPPHTHTHTGHRS